MNIRDKIAELKETGYDVGFKVYELDDFASRSFCSSFLAKIGNHFRPAVTYGCAEPGNRVAETRLITEGVTSMRNAIARIASMPEENIETLSIIRYAPGGEYKPHCDFFHPEDDYYQNAMKRGGQRVKTVLLYLNEDFEGGETLFPDIDLTIKPKTGKLVMWSNTDENGVANLATVHSGLPVKKGIKYLISAWIREGRFS